MSPPADFESAASTDFAIPAVEPRIISREAITLQDFMPQTIDDFVYELPERLIAQAPLAQRHASRLLVVGSDLSDQHFAELPGLVQPGDLLVFNDTRVLHARLVGVKDSGGAVEVLFERLLGPNEALAQVRASNSPHAGSRLRLADAFDVTVLGRSGEFFHLCFPAGEDVFELVERYGKLPLPPYIRRDAVLSDEARYQTVYARDPGSAAAPTAGLHFDTEMLDTLRGRGVNLAWLTLHVGAGTFQPVRVHDLSEHKMHREHYMIPEVTVEAIRATRAAGGRVISVGTTSMRALEAAAREG